MNMMFVLFVVALFIAMIFLMMRANMRRNNARERLLYAFESRPDVPVEELNLSAGDYGLEGGARFLYFLTQFLSSPGGYVGVFAVGAALGALLKIVLHLDKFSYLMIGILAGAILMVGSNIYIAAKRKERVRKIRYELPNALQSIVAVMESGLAFESALQHVVRESGIHHPLYFDLQVVLDAMQQGRRRNDALKLWATRANERSVSDVTAAMIQADQTGAAIGGVLRHHATTQLKEIEAELLKKAERIPIYMIMPMMICILPPIFLVAVGPSVIRIFRMFEVIMSRS